MVLTMVQPSSEMTVLPGFPGHVTAVAYRLPPETDFETYKFVVGSLMKLDRGVSWWLGDALLQFDADFGARYTSALPDREAEPGLYQRCADAKWLASKFPVSFRNEKLTITHHRAVVSMAQEERTIWLDRAAKNLWTVRNLRDNLQLARKTVLELEAPDLLQEQLRQSIANRIPGERDPEGTSTSPPLPRRPMADSGVDDFLEGKPAAEQTPPASSRFPDQVPRGQQFSPVEPQIIAQLYASWREDLIQEGGILTPVWVFDQLWWPVRAELTETGRCTIDARRIMRDADYLEAGYADQLPTMSFEEWNGPAGEGKRAVQDYSGVRVWSKPYGGALWYVVLPQRATFVGRMPGEETETVDGSIVDPGQGAHEAEEYDFPVMIGEQSLRKLDMLVNHLNRKGGDVTAEELLEGMIDARFEASGLDLADYEGAAHGKQ